MSLLSHRIRAVAPPIRRSLQRQTRRFDSHQAGHDAEHGHHESALHVAGGSGNESMGRGFYIALAVVPLSMVVYTIASSPKDNAISRMVDKYKPDENAENSRNLLHIAMMEQATRDRQLFEGHGHDNTGPELRYTESFNVGSPWNVVAGEGRADLAELAKHYADKHKRSEDERTAKMENGKVLSLYDESSNPPEVERR